MIWSQLQIILLSQVGSYYNLCIGGSQKGRDLDKNLNKYLLFIDLSAPKYMLKYTLFIVS